MRNGDSLSTDLRSAGEGSQLSEDQGTLWALLADTQTLRPGRAGAELFLTEDSNSKTQAGQPSGSHHQVGDLVGVIGSGGRWSHRRIRTQLSMWPRKRSSGTQRRPGLSAC